MKAYVIRTEQMCSEINCVACIAERMLGEKGWEIGKTCKVKIMPCLWANVVQWAVITEDGTKSIGIPLSMDKISLAHDWCTESKGLTALYRKGVRTLADVAKMTKQEIEAIYGVGRITVAEVERLLWYYGIPMQDLQGRLFPDNPDEYPSY